MSTELAGKPPSPVELLRLQRGVTRRAMAAALGVNDRALSRIEKGVSWPTPPIILRLATALGLSVEDLFDALLQGWLARHDHLPRVQP